MHSSEKLIFGISAGVLAIFMFAILVASKGMRIEVTECLVGENIYEEGKVVQLDDHLFQIYYVASMWRFEPEVIEIPVGSEVDIYLTSKDVVHGLHINERNVNMMAVPGNIGLKRVKFPKKGIFDVVCHEYCGVGHQAMRSRIIVK